MKFILSAPQQTASKEKKAEKSKSSRPKSKKPKPTESSQASGTATVPAKTTEGTYYNIRYFMRIAQ